MYSMLIVERHYDDDDKITHIHSSVMNFYEEDRAQEAKNYLKSLHHPEGASQVSCYIFDVGDPPK